jgi:hypothetical protein
MISLSDLPNLMTGSFGRAVTTSTPTAARLRADHCTAAARLPPDFSSFGVHPEQERVAPPAKRHTWPHSAGPTKKSPAAVSLDCVAWALSIPRARK